MYAAYGFAILLTTSLVGIAGLRQRRAGVHGVGSDEDELGEEEADSA